MSVAQDLYMHGFACGHVTGLCGSRYAPIYVSYTILSHLKWSRARTTLAQEVAPHRRMAKVRRKN